ncbi:hypothetical protein [Marinicrinis lubricantis]|uniref:EfeO-type cupredoxin-like domain-containing protein n=1 Tax=Marinicrinis lubricantis TaxID=2086470 RepID=A0ABW1IJG8_9BACL
MTKIMIINRKKIYLYVGAAILLIAAVIYFTRPSAELFSAEVGAKAGQERIFEMVTGEFSSETKDGQKIEAYRWDPGTIVVNEGDLVTLKMYGVNGSSHPFTIEGYNIQGNVVKGEETVVSFTADKEGIFKIICHTHTDNQSSGPMVGYLVVQ